MRYVVEYRIHRSGVPAEAGSVVVDATTGDDAASQGQMAAHARAQGAPWHIVSVYPAPQQAAQPVAEPAQPRGKAR